METQGGDSHQQTTERGPGQMLSLQSLEGTNPANIFIWDELCDSYYLLLKPPSLWCFVMAA